MTITISLTGAESVIQRRAAFNALAAYAAAFGDIGIDAPDVGVAQPPALPPTPETPVPPAAAVFAPQPAAEVAVAPAPAVELDSEGQPWNAELHASTKAKIADGTWRKKRGTAPEAPAAAPVAPPAPVAAVPAAPAPAPTPVAPPAPAAKPALSGFAGFMANVMPLIKAGKIAGLRINELCQSVGVANMGMASGASQDQLDTIWALIQAEPGVAA